MNYNNAPFKVAPDKFTRIEHVKHIIQAADMLNDAASDKLAIVPSNAFLQHLARYIKTETIQLRTLL